MIRILRGDDALYQFKAVSNRYCTMKVFYTDEDTDGVVYDEVVFLPTARKEILFVKFIDDDELVFSVYINIHQILQLVDGFSCVFVLSDNMGIYSIDNYGEGVISSSLSICFETRSY